MLLHTPHSQARALLRLRRQDVRILIGGSARGRPWVRQQRQGAGTQRFVFAATQDGEGAMAEQRVQDASCLISIVAVSACQHWPDAPPLLLAVGPAPLSS